MSPKKRRYVGNANAKKRQEVEGMFDTQNHYRRALDHTDQTLPSPEKVKPKDIQAGLEALDILTQKIIHYEHTTKTFKTEDWYSSPAGYGAVSNAIIAALSVNDKARNGFVSIDDIIDTFTKINFGTFILVKIISQLEGLCENQIRQLISETTCKSNADQIHYKTFAKQFDLAPTKREDPIMRREKHVALLRERLNEPSRVQVPSSIGKRKMLRTPFYLDKIHPLPSTTDVLPQINEKSKDIDTAKSPRQLNFDFNEKKLPSPTRYSAKNAEGVIPQTATTFKLGDDTRNTPNSLRRSKLLPQVVDQSKKDRRRKAKQEILADHIERIDGYAAAEDYKTKLNEENHIKATTAKHLAYNQAFLEHSKQLTSKEHQKGLLYSSIAQQNHNVKALESIVCESCETISEPLKFCGNLRSAYPICALQSKSLADQDAIAEANYALFNATLSIADNESTCGLTLKQIVCMKAFPACELTQARSLCASACKSELNTNCSSVLSTVKPMMDKTCGKTDLDKCITFAYSGPNRGAWVAGFIISVVFSFLASVGINLQKKALKQNELKAQENNTAPLPPFRLPLWTLGFVLILTGSLLDFVAFAMAPQSLLAPLAALTLVWNMLLAPCFNKERLTRKDIWATLVIFVGATLAVVFASHNSPSYTLDDLKLLYDNTGTIVYFVIVLILILLHYTVIKCVESLNMSSRRHRMINVGKPAVWSTVRLVAYSGMGGLMGGQSVLFAKSTAELVKSAINGGDCFQHPETYAIIVALGVCLVLQMHFLNGGLVNYDALSVVPIYQAYWIISGVMGGAIYFQEIRSFSEFQATMFVLGILTTIGGVALLAQRSLTSPPPTLKKRKSLTTRNMSSYWHNPKSPMTKTETIAEEEEEGSSNNEEAASAMTVGSSEIEEKPDETKESSSDDEESKTEEDETVNRQAIDNFLNMSTMGSFLMGYTSQRNLGIFLRRDSSRPASTRTAVDDFEIGLPPARQESEGGEEAQAKKPKRRSITFAGFKSSSKSSIE
ncbi:hypothetical protein THRCLA_05234 [Thraustotheca clavata]|uniref:FZ domain-containing protein n=1 Tax=Thraustotheca clavata TaxID=74557 RepID=A0A1V9ZWQ6_9STRA|nr:hypothetical protein THRCLA_05234 [Thraustotheca clavata]